MSPSAPTAQRLARSLRSLQALDATILHNSGRLSLSPSRASATPLHELPGQATKGSPDDGVACAVAEGLASLAEAVLHAFPENIFWDLDLLTFSIVRSATGESDAARAGGSPAARIQEAFDTLTSLQNLFGGDTPIRFRYVHDFIYGFDWAKWVRQAPEERRGVGPFDPPFLAFLWKRGHELLQLIAEDDAKYPRLKTPDYRNPFGFPRTPPCETQVFRELARRDLLPVRAWQREDTPRCDRDYRAVRASVAHELGLTASVAGEDAT